jgi:hypothetical protein
MQGGRATKDVGGALGTAATGQAMMDILQSDIASASGGHGGCQRRPEITEAQNLICLTAYRREGRADLSRLAGYSVKLGESVFRRFRD